MILKEWIKSNFERIFKGVQISTYDHQLHVVGTCGSCRYWNCLPGEENTVWCESYKSEQTCTEWQGDCE